VDEPLELLIIAFDVWDQSGDGGSGECSVCGKFGVVGDSSDGA